MPQVDFTLEEVKGSIRTVVQEELKPVWQEIGSLRGEMSSVQERIGSLESDMGSLQSDMGSLRQEIGSLRQDMHQEIGSLRQELELFQGAVATSFHDLTNSMNEQFTEVRSELGHIRRLTRQHSADIAELRAASA